MFAINLKVTSDINIQNTDNFKNNNHTKSSSVFLNDARTGGGIKNLEANLTSKFKKLEVNYIMESFNNFKLENLYTSIENSFYIFLDFLLIGNANSLIYILLFTVLLNKLFTIFKKMISHEKSKKLYFLFYLTAISYILGQCLILVTSNSSDTSDQGILLLYIYVTATLMLFLIFLALTTCESYLYKEKDATPTVGKISIFKILLNVFILFCTVAYYDSLMTEVVDAYYAKLSIVTNVESKFNSFDVTVYNSNLNKYSALYKVDSSN